VGGEMTQALYAHMNKKKKKKECPCKKRQSQPKELFYIKGD
jgi:hypothetical protein